MSRPLIFEGLEAGPFTCAAARRGEPAPFPPLPAAALPVDEWLAVVESAAALAAALTPWFALGGPVGAGAWDRTLEPAPAI